MNPFRMKRHRLEGMRILQDEGRRMRPKSTESLRDALVHCPGCERFIPRRTMEETGSVCPVCGHHLPLTGPERLRRTFDEGRFFELNPDLSGGDPLDFPGYAGKLADMRERTGLPDAAVCGVGRIGGRPTVAAVLDSRFFMGSMGTGVGEKVTRAIEYATRKRLPLVIFSASGGARMQEGIFSLMQMAKTSAAIARHDEAGLLFVSVMTHPTTGGVTASFASLGDVILAEPGALIGFAGPRVIEQTIGQKLPKGFQRSESLLRDGFLDAIVERDDMRAALAFIISFAAARPPCEPLPSPRPRAEESVAGGGPSPTERLSLARDVHRPHIHEYIETLFDGFFELHGDRCFADDPSIVGGFASFHGAPVMVIGQRKGDDVATNITCNFGMPQPEGYRKVRRLARLADKFRRPLMTFIDTPGAYPGIEAEQRGQGQAIACCLETFSRVHAPVIATLVGEGGSGGALALGVADTVMMLEHAVYAVLSPEGFAAILWKDGSRAAEACDVMKITSADLKEAGVVDRIIAEGPYGIQKNRDSVFALLDEALSEELARLSGFDVDGLLQERYRKFRGIGPCVQKPSGEAAFERKEVEA